MVPEMRNLANFDARLRDAVGKIAVVMYHNGRQSSEEQALEDMHQQYKNLMFLKVNTLEAVDIANTHADGGPKPYYKFYAYGAMIDEVKYLADKDELKKKLKE